jgi:hypothetical protein
MRREDHGLAGTVIRQIADMSRRGEGTVSRLVLERCLVLGKPRVLLGRLALGHDSLLP